MIYIQHLNVRNVMSQQLTEFIQQARAKGLGDTVVRARLVAAGWPGADVDAALTGPDQRDELDGLVVPAPPAVSAQEPGAGVSATAAATGQNAPISVVENLTARGFEYKLFSVSLVLSLAALLLIANFMISGNGDWNASAFPVTMLVVTGPIALLLFIRLHHAELMQPALKHDASRRKVLQAIQLVTFLTVVGHTIILLYLLLSGYYNSTDNGHPSFASGVLRWVVTLLLAGGTFWYYWRDEHRHA
jgi:hypothetical protein